MSLFSTKPVFAEEFVVAPSVPQSVRDVLATMFPVREHVDVPAGQVFGFGRAAELLSAVERRKRGEPTFLDERIRKAERAIEAFRALMPIPEHALSPSIEGGRGLDALTDAQVAQEGRDS